MLLIFQIKCLIICYQHQNKYNMFSLDEIICNIYLPFSENFNVSYWIICEVNAVNNLNMSLKPSSK